MPSTPPPQKKANGRRVLADEPSPEVGESSDEKGETEDTESTIEESHEGQAIAPHDAVESSAPSAEALIENPVDDVATKLD